MYLVNVPYKLLHNKRNHCLREVAKLIVLKQAFVNSVIYNGNIGIVHLKLQEKGLEVSKEQVFRWIDDLKKLKYIKIRNNGDILLKSLEAIDQKSYKRKKIYYSDYYDLVNKLYAEVMKIKGDQCDNERLFRSTFENDTFKQAGKSRKQFFSKMKKYHELQNKEKQKSLSISIDGLAKIWNTTRSTAHRIVTRLIKAGLIVKRKYLTCLGKGNAQSVKNIDFQGVFLFKGKIYKREICEYVFTY